MKNMGGKKELDEVKDKREGTQVLYMFLLEENKETLK